MFSPIALEKQGGLQKGGGADQQHQLLDGFVASSFFILQTLDSHSVVSQFLQLSSPKICFGRFQLRKVPKFHFTYLYLSVCNTLILSPNSFLNVTKEEDNKKLLELPRVN